MWGEDKNYNFGYYSLKVQSYSDKGIFVIITKVKETSFIVDGLIEQQNPIIFAMQQELCGTKK